MSKIILSDEFLADLNKERARVADILNVLNPEDENAEIPEMDFEFADYVLYLNDLRDVYDWTITE